MEAAQDLIDNVCWEDNIIKLPLKQLVLFCVASTISGCLGFFVLNIELVRMLNSFPVRELSLVNNLLMVLEINVNYYCMLLSFDACENWYYLCCEMMTKVMLN